MYDIYQGNKSALPEVAEDPTAEAAPAVTPAVTPAPKTDEAVTKTTVTSVSPQRAEAEDASKKASEYISNFLETRINAYKPETEEEKKKRLRREKSMSTMAGISDALAAFHKTYSHARGVKAMDIENAGAKVAKAQKEAKAARDADDAKHLGYLAQLKALKDGDRSYFLKVDQFNREGDQWQKTFDYNKGKDDRDFNWKKDTDKRDYDRAVLVSDRKYDLDKNDQDFRHKFQQASLNETRRHNGVVESQGQQRLNSDDAANGMIFGTDDETITIPRNSWTDANIAYIFSKTPMQGRPQPQVTLNGTVPVSQEEMVNWIGKNINDANVKGALNRLARGGNSSNDNTPPGRR